MAAAAAITTAVVAAAGTTYGVIKQGEARKEQQKFQEDQAAKQASIFEDQKKSEEAARAEQKALNDEAANANAEADFQKGAAQRRETAKNRQRRIAAGATGRSDTILTGPSGLSDEPLQVGKTILGA